MSVLRSFALALGLPLAFAPFQPPASALPPGPSGPASPPSIDFSRHVDANNLDMFLTNIGAFAWDGSSGNPGLVYPRGSQLAVVYSAGIWIGARVGGETRVAIADYAQEYVPGPVVSGSYAPDWQTNTAYRTYKIQAGDTPETNPDYAGWPIAQGAPFRIADGDTVPLIIGRQTLWSVFNDLNPEFHIANAGSTAPLGIEVQETAFAFDSGAGLDEAIIMRHKITNAGQNTLTGAYVGIWVDPDLGGPEDDLVGFDRSRSLGYCYNADDDDTRYGSNPPAVGFDILRKPVDPSTGLPTGVSGFAAYRNGEEPPRADCSYNLLRGLLRDGSPRIDPTTGLATPFAYPGDPVAGTGWNDLLPSDKRMMLCCGPFDMAPGDTQLVVTAVIVARGGSRLASVSALRYSSDVVQAAFERGFVSPTAIALLSLCAERTRGGARVRWEVAQGAEGTAFHVFRDSGSGPAERLTPRPLSGQRQYEFVDPSAPSVEVSYRLQAIGRDGATEWLGPVTLAAAGVSRVLALAAAPNPLNGRTSITYGLPRDARVELAVYDAQGRLVAALVNKAQSAGTYAVPWNGRTAGGAPAPAGVYWVRLDAGAALRTTKVVLTR